MYEFLYKRDFDSALHLQGHFLFSYFIYYTFYMSLIDSKVWIRALLNVFLF